MRIDRTDIAFAVFAAGSGALCAWLGGLDAVERALASAGRTLLTIVPLFAAGMLLVAGEARPEEAAMIRVAKAIGREIGHLFVQIVFQRALYLFVKTRFMG